MKFADELESKCLAQARICNLENERLMMSGREERARYWEGRSDAFQDCIAFVRALAQPQASERLEEAEWWYGHQVVGCLEHEERIMALRTGKPVLQQGVREP